MRRLVSTLIICIILLSFTGCKSLTMGKTEINKIDFIRAVAIDKSVDKEGYIRIVITSERVKVTGGGQSGDKESTSVISEGKTVFEAIRNLSTFKEKRPFWGHLDFVIIGEEAARDGISEYIDFFSRDHEVRLNLKLFIVKGIRAEEVLEKTNKKDMFVFDRLSGLVEGLGVQSVSDEVNLIEIMRILDINYVSLYIPTIELVHVTQSKEDEKDTEDIRLGGFAFFNGDKLEGFLNNEKARGLNWIKDKIKSGIIVVKSPKGENVSLEIIDSKVKIKPKKINNKLRVTVEVEMQSNVGEIQSTEDIFNGETFEYLNKQQKKIIEDEIESTLELAQEEGLDFFNIGSAVYHKYPKDWEDYYKKRWERIFSDIDFDISVKSNILRTYDIKQPNRSNGEEKS